MSSTPIKDVYCVVIGYREYLNWSAYGVLRLSRSRIHYFDGTDETFDILMYSANDFNNNNEIGIEYFFVVLNDDYQKNTIKRVGGEYFYLSFHAVSGLYAFNETAFDRMIGGAKMAKVRLSLDEDLTALANQWQQKHNQCINHYKAERLLEIFGLKSIDCDANPFEKMLEKTDLADKNITSREHKIGYAWAVSNYYISYILNKKDELLKIYEDNNGLILNFYKEFSKEDIKQSLNMALSDKTEFLNERQRVQEIISEEENLLLFTFYVHYKMLFGEYFEQLNEQIFLAMAKDVDYIKQYYSEKEAAQLIYWIGVLLPELFVSQLYYAKNSKAFKSIDAELFDEVYDLLKKANLLTVSSENNHQTTPFIEQNSDSMMPIPTIQNDVQVEESIENHQDNKLAMNSDDIKSDSIKEDFSERKEGDGDNLQELISQIVDKDPNLRINDLEERIKRKFPGFKFCDWYNEQAKHIKGYEAITSKKRVIDGKIRKILKELTDKKSLRNDLLSIGERGSVL